MGTINNKVIAGSIIKTQDQALWYSCGDWRLKGMDGSLPCILTYIPEESFPSGLKTPKKVTSDKMSFFKVFGHYGVSLDDYRNVLISEKRNMLYPISLGRTVFLKEEYILEIKDPLVYREKYFKESEESNIIFRSLIEILEIPIESIGIGGSALALDSSVGRKDVDFGIYGLENCIKALTQIEKNRNDHVFSRLSLPPYHMPFQYKGIWFDPHFSEPKKEGVLNGASISIIRKLGEMTLSITDDSDGIFFPAIYYVEGEKKLISFWTSHRGLYQKGQRVKFESLSEIEISFPNGFSEIVLAVIDNEWGQKM